MGYDPALHRVLRNSEERHPWFRARALLVAHLLEKFAKPSPAVLDEGCGTGWSSSTIARIAGTSLMVGTDVSTAEAASARPPGVALVRSDIAAAPFRRAFDALLLLDVLEHFDDDRGALVSAAQALAPDGLLIVTVPAMPSLWSGYDAACGHFRRYTRRSLLDLLGGCGFETVFCSHFVCLPAPLLLLRKSRSEGEAIASAGFGIGGASSALLRLYLSVELVLIRAGLRMPWGSSLAAAARTRTKQSVTRS